MNEDDDLLTNLYVASSQLHSTLDLKEVVGTVLEICLNLVGASYTVVYVHDEDRASLSPVVTYGGDVPTEEIDLSDPEVSASAVGDAMRTGRTHVEEGAHPLVIVPLAVSDRIIGAVMIHDLLPQKERLSQLDHELFELLSRQGAAAVLSAFLAGSAPVKLNAADFRKKLEG